MPADSSCPFDPRDLPIRLAGLGKVVGGLHGEPGVGPIPKGHVDSDCQVGGDRRSAVADACQNLLVNLHMFRCLIDREVDLLYAVA